MAVKFRCEKCGKLLRAQVSAGESVMCPHCSNISAAPQLSALPVGADGGIDLGRRRVGGASITAAAPWAVSLLVHLCIAAAVIVFGVGYASNDKEDDSQMVLQASISASQQSRFIRRPNLAKVSLLKTPLKTPDTPERRFGSPQADLDLKSRKPVQPVELDLATELPAAANFASPSTDSSAKVSFFGSAGRVASNIVFVIDRSGSMHAGDAFTEVCLEMARSLSGMTSAQTFQVILFSTGESPGQYPPKGISSATQQNKLRAARWLKQQSAGGGPQTDPTAALEAAFAALAKTSRRRPGNMIYLLTDGVFADDQKVLASIRRLNSSRAVQINSYLYGSMDARAVSVMKQIAAEHGGVFTYISGDE